VKLVHCSCFLVLLDFFSWKWVRFCNCDV